MTFNVNTPPATASSSHTTRARSPLFPDARSPPYMPCAENPFGAQMLLSTSFHDGLSGIMMGAAGISNDPGMEEAAEQRMDAARAELLRVLLLGVGA